jgi:hypothetical protein
MLHSDAIAIFAWEVEENYEKNSAKLSSNAAEIRTRYPSITNVEHYVRCIYGRQFHPECCLCAVLVDTSSATEVSCFSGQSMALSIINERARKYQ